MRQKTSQTDKVRTTDNFDKEGINREDEEIDWKNGAAFYLLRHEEPMRRQRGIW